MLKIFTCRVFLKIVLGYCIELAKCLYKSIQNAEYFEKWPHLKKQANDGLIHLHNKSDCVRYIYFFKIYIL